MPMIDKKRFDELRSTGQLPSPSGVAMEIIRLAQSPTTGLPELARVIERDPALLGRLLKVVNSCRFAARRPILQADDAVIRLGMTAVRNLALGFSVLSRYRTGRCAEFNYPLYWMRSLITGLAAGQINDDARVCPTGEAFAFGLLAQIGRLALATVYPEKYGTVLRDWDGAWSEELLCLERQAFGTDHLELSAAMLQDWGFPEVFQFAALHQESPDHAPGEIPPRAVKLARVLHLADAMAEHQISPQELRCRWDIVLAERGAVLSLRPERLPEMLARTEQELTDWGKVLQVPVRAESREEANRHNTAAGPGLDATPVEAAQLPGGMRILVADDDPASQRLLKRVLDVAGHTVFTASNGREALQMTLESRPQVVISDWMMPELSGLDLCRALRLTKFGRQIYLIVLTANNDEGHLVEAFSAGADDYLTKPLQARALLARIQAGRRVIELQSEVARDREQLQRTMADLSVANRKLEQAALTDLLTGLMNRRSLVGLLDDMWDQSSRSGRPLSCIMFDIDHFKGINDRFGHDRGDVVLQRVAAILRGASRRSTPLARYGGEEFVALCGETDLAGAMEFAERMRRAVEESTAGLLPESGAPITVSAGVATRTAGMNSPDDLLKVADLGLYQAKISGRNRVSAYPSLSAGDPTPPSAELSLPPAPRAFTTIATTPSVNP